MQKLEDLQENRYYHIYNRGNNRKNLFLEERNYDFFLARYQKYICPVADTFAYCLLGNHFHLLIRVKPQERPHRSPLASGSPSRAFSNFFSSYTQSMNSLYGRTGSLFQERFRRKEVTGNDSLRAVMQYIHLNPLFTYICQGFSHVQALVVSNTPRQGDHVSSARGSLPLVRRQTII